MQSADDRRRARDLEEARKAGTVPAELDVEGNEINPHIPQFMSQAPWYLNAEGPGLQHQKNMKEKKAVAGVTDFVPRGQKLGKAATVFRKGACTNCGAMTHAAKDCVERPRKKGARFTGKNIQADEAIVEMAYDYAGKRDHWAQYDPSDHTRVIEAHEKEIEIRLVQHKQEQMAKLATKDIERQQKADAKKRKRAEAGGAEGEGGAEEESSDADTDADTDAESGSGPEEKVNESEQRNVGTKMNANRNGGAKMSVRNLRIREDTAKYLLNLDVNSAYYDPKTRSMRDNPLTEEELRAKSVDFINYNDMKQTGDARELAALQLYELDAYEKGQNLHLQADPTTLEMMNKIYKDKKANLKSSKVNKVLEKYGGQEHLQQPPAELLFAQTEDYAEYTRSGAVRGDAPGKKKAVVRSKYEEDIHAHNHTAIWGSFFDRQAFRWGYADDLATVRNAYGTGEAGKQARQLANARQNASANVAQAQMQQQQQAGSSSSGGAALPNSSRSVPQSSMYGTGEQLEGAELDADKVRMHMKEQKSHAKSNVGDERKRKYNAGAGTTSETTAEEMEAYHRSKHRADDPMAQMAEADTDDEA